MKQFQLATLIVAVVLAIAAGQVQSDTVDDIDALVQKIQAEIPTGKVVADDVTRLATLLSNNSLQLSPDLIKSLQSLSNGVTGVDPILGKLLGSVVSTLGQPIKF